MLPLQQRASAAAGAADHIARQPGGNDKCDVSNGVVFADSLAAAMDLPIAPTRAVFFNALQNGRQSQGLAGSEFGPSSGLPGLLKDSEGRVMPAAAGLYDRALHGERRACAHCNILQWSGGGQYWSWD